VSGRGSRIKGQVWERALVKRFRDAMPDAEIKRGMQFRSGEEAPDVEMPCFRVEAKHHNRTNIKAALRQAIEAAPKGRWPIAVCKDDHQPAMATMLLDDFLDLIAEWWAGKSR
jgi:hypothetical protein